MVGRVGSCRGAHGEDADTAAAEGRHATAGNYYMRAGNYYYTGERMIPPGEQKLEMYKKSLHCFHEGATRRYPNVEIIDVPYEGTALPAYFMKSPVAKGPAPTVVLFDGLDNCKEMSVLFAGVELAFRGFHTLAIDGPGQGEALRLRNLPSRYDYEVAGHRCLRITSPAATTSTRSASRSWPTAPAAITRRAPPPSSSATPPASRGARITTITRCGRSAGQR